METTNLSQENIDALKKIKESIEECAIKYQFHLTDAAVADSNMSDSVYNGFCKMIEEQKEKDPNKIIYDENGGACYLKDVKVVNHGIKDHILHVTLEGHSNDLKLSDITWPAISVFDIDIIKPEDK